MHWIMDLSRKTNSVNQAYGGLSSARMYEQLVHGPCHPGSSSYSVSQYIYPFLNKLINSVLTHVIG